MAVIGLDLGGTKIAAALFSNVGEVLQKNVVHLDKRAGSAVGMLITGEIKKLIDYGLSIGNAVKAIGVSVPGISYSKTGKVWAPNIPGWDNYPLLEEILAVTGDNEIVVKIDSDRACCILGEKWQGAAQGCSDAIFLAVGTGIGAGILTNGEILRGSNDIAGAIGWLALDRPYKEKYISCGCFEYHASGEGLARVAREFLSEDTRYTGKLKDKPIEEITAYDVFQGYEDNDDLAKLVLSLAVEYWGMTTANLVSLFNPEKIIFGGGVFGPASKFLGDIMLEARKWAQPVSINQVTLEPSQLSGDAALYGAGYLALRNINYIA